MITAVHATTVMIRRAKSLSRQKERSWVAGPVTERAEKEKLFLLWSRHRMRVCFSLRFPLSIWPQGHLHHGASPPTCPV